MRTIEIHLNITFGSAFLSYQPGDKMRCAWRGGLDLPTDDDQALAIIWAKFQNIDDVVVETQADALFGEQSYEDRSLSMGDVVTLDGKSYAAVTFGFKPLINPIVGGPIVGPEGDEELRKAAAEGPATSLLAAGVLRMTKDLER